MLHQAFFVTSSPYVNSNWSYGPETAKLGFDLCDLDLRHLTLSFCMVNVSQTDGRTEGQTLTIHIAAWSQLKRKASMSLETIK